MPVLEIERAWSDADYRATLTDGEFALLPESPAGEMLEDFEIRDPKVDPLYNSWASCWVSWDSGTPDCCAG